MASPPQPHPGQAIHHAIDPQNFVLSIVIPCFKEPHPIGTIVEAVRNTEIRNNHCRKANGALFRNSDRASSPHLP